MFSTELMWQIVHLRRINTYRPKKTFNSLPFVTTISCYFKYRSFYFNRITKGLTHPGIVSYEIHRKFSFLFLYFCELQRFYVIMNYLVLKTRVSYFYLFRKKIFVQEVEGTNLSTRTV